jgi:hypothetical protein
VLEHRCPKIRNTVAWAVEMSTRSTNTSSTNSHSSKPSIPNNSTTNTNATTSTSNTSTTSSSSLAAAVAWQMNRNLATKIRVHQEGITAALLVKRWAYPGVTLSLLGGYRYGGSGGGNIQQTPFSYGLGVQLDTSLYNNHHQNDIVHAKGRGTPTPTTSGKNHIPKTRMELPMPVNR